ncbi:hypothetical protein D3C72_2061150 [compost metagenome]
MNSVIWRLPRAWQKARKLPGCSGIVTAMIASRCSPSSARSATWRKRSKLTLAPESMATRVCPCTPSRATYFLIPATAKAPDGSVIERVSS